MPTKNTNAHELDSLMEWFFWSWVKVGLIVFEEVYPLFEYFEHSLRGGALFGSFALEDGLAFAGGEEGGGEGVFLGALGESGSDAGGGGGFVEFVVEIDAADDGVVGVDGGEEVVLEEAGEGMGGEGLYGVGLEVAGEVDLEADAAVGDELDEAGVVDGADAVTDAGSAEVLDGVADICCAAGFSGVDGDLPAGVAAAFEVFVVELAGPAGFVAGEVEGAKLVAVFEEGFEFCEAGFGAEGAAHDADEAGGEAEVAFRCFGSIDDCGGDVGGVEAMGLGHEERAEAELEVVEAFCGGVLDAFVGDASAGVGVAEDEDHPFEAVEEADEIGLGAGEDDVWVEGVDGVAWELEAVLLGEGEHGFEADAAFEVAVEVDEGELGVDHGTDRREAGGMPERVVVESMGYLSKEFGFWLWIRSGGLGFGVG